MYIYIYKHICSDIWHIQWLTVNNFFSHNNVSILKKCVCTIYKKKSSEINRKGICTVGILSKTQVLMSPCYSNVLQKKSYTTLLIIVWLLNKQCLETAKFLMVQSMSLSVGHAWLPRGPLLRTSVVSMVKWLFLPHLFTAWTFKNPHLSR